MRIGLERGLIERLDLTADQQERIDVILRDQRTKAEAVLGEIQPRLTARLDSTNAQIRAVLTAEQQKDFDSYIASGRGNIFRRMPWGPSPSRPQ
jgi:Spy/CpxP family protein refolding chaperone